MSISLNTIDPARFSAKEPGEIITLAFDFVEVVGSQALSAPQVTISVVSGTDGSPSSMLSGSAVALGSKVTQRVIGGLAGVTYKLRAQVDAADGSRYVLAGLLPVRVA